MAKETLKEIIKLYNDEVEITFYPVSHQYRENGKIKTSVTGATGMLDKSIPLMIWAGKVIKGYLMDVRGTGKVISEEDITNAIKQPNQRKETAGDVGTKIHDWCEAYALAQIFPKKHKSLEMPCDDDPDSKAVSYGILAFLKWVDENGVKFVAAEKFIYSREYDYVGKTDIIFTLAKEDHKILHVGDYKSAAGIYSSSMYQASGYTEAIIEENKVTKLFSRPFGSDFIIRFAKEDKFDKKTGELIEHAGTFEVKEISVEDRKKNFACYLGLLTCKNRDKELQKEWRDAQKLLKSNK